MILIILYSYTIDLIRSISNTCIVFMLSFNII
nr:MAG TPA: hypothetical protein [Caudoviricetes sp.]